MKKLILSTVLMAFAIAVQAGDAQTDKTAAQDKPACCAKAKTMTSETKGECPMMAKQQTMAGCSMTECGMAEKTAFHKHARVKQQVLLSPKQAAN